MTLLGDAAHPMLPFMAQGAAQALEDGVSLTACLSKIGDVAAAFAQYEKLRLPRTSRMQAMSAANKTRFHLPDGSDQQERDAKMAAGTTDWSIKAIAWVYNYDAALAVETGDFALPPDV
jgi:2-polyprenyl-6-methoxyphenol hydroxylase-like FAD-dependent oxidoreductase